MAAIRTALVDWRKYLVGVFTQVLGNPVIGRELRVRVRVGRAYLLQAFYLAFLILIVALAYQAAIGDNPDLRNPVRVQEALVEFYRIVMSMLVALIALIAPALTANAITLERERKTMDLLLATPLTAPVAGGQANRLVRVYRAAACVNAACERGERAAGRSVVS